LYAMSPALIFKKLRNLSTQYLCVLYDSHNNQRLFRQTAWTGWYYWCRVNVFTMS
jgi:hypothetical protein